MREIKMKVYTSGGMIGPFDLSQHPMYWAHKLRDGERLLYTGLTDKNGVEIYEGDILKTPTEKVGQVFFHANGGWLVETKEYEFNLVKITATGQSEVIGNIYENPELLEESK